MSFLRVKWDHKVSPIIKHFVEHKVPVAGFHEQDLNGRRCIILFVDDSKKVQALVKAIDKDEAVSDEWRFLNFSTMDNETGKTAIELIFIAAMRQHEL